jgi:phospholipase/carboxylesterase
MRQVSLGPLQAFIVPAEQAAPEARSPLWTVLLHGFGAPATDLVGLTRALGPLPGVVFVYPAALHSLGYGFGEGRAWWPIDFNELDGARRRGDFDAIAQSEPRGLSEARTALGSALDALEKDHGLERQRLVLGGFSQGAMLACDYALRSNSPLAGLVLLSGMPIALGTWSERMQTRRGLPVFQSHSPDDLVLPFELARQLAADLAEAGLDHQFVPFRGGHGIPQPVLEGLRAFLRARAAEGAT